MHSWHQGRVRVDAWLVSVGPCLIYVELFGWEFDTGDAATEAVSQKGNCGYVDGRTVGGINGGVGGGEGYEPRALFYVSVPNVEEALAAAERLGGRRVMVPEGEAGTIVVGHFTDLEGNLIGVPAPSKRGLPAEASQRTVDVDQGAGHLSRAGPYGFFGPPLRGPHLRPVTDLPPVTSFSSEGDRRFYANGAKGNGEGLL